MIKTLIQINNIRTTIIYKTNINTNNKLIKNVTYMYKLYSDSRKHPHVYINKTNIYIYIYIYTYFIIIIIML